MAWRTREIAIRIALGNSRSGIMRMVLKSTAVVASAGVAAGLLLAAVFSRGLGSLLYKIGPLDVVTFEATTVVFLALILLTAAAAASQAMRIEPSTALKPQ